MAMRRGMRGDYKPFPSRPNPVGRAATLLPQFFGSFPFSSPGGALFGRFNTRQGPKRALHKRRSEMEASSSRSRVRPIVVDFLATLFLTFCIGVAAAVVLGACVMLMAAEARGAEPGERLPMKTV